MKRVYLILAIAGLVLPYYFFVSFLMANGLNGRLFFQELFATKIATFFAVDLVLSCVVFVSFLREEATRHRIGASWLYLVVMLTVGLSCALPLFLYARESRIEQGEKAGSD